MKGVRRLLAGVPSVMFGPTVASVSPFLLNPKRPLSSGRGLFLGCGFWIFA